MISQNPYCWAPTEACRISHSIFWLFLDNPSWRDYINYTKNRVTRTKTKVFQYYGSYPYPYTYYTHIHHLLHHNFVFNRCIWLISMCIWFSPLNPCQLFVYCIVYKLLYIWFWYNFWLLICIIAFPSQCREDYVVDLGINF